MKKNLHSQYYVTTVSRVNDNMIDTDWSFK